MRQLATTASVIILLILLGACSGVPANTPALPTSALSATPTSGSTEVAPAATTGAMASPTQPSELAAEPTPTRNVAATEAPPTASPEPTTPPAPTATVAPEPTMPSAPTDAAPIACTPGTLTPVQTEGPYYSENPPESSALAQPGMSGTKLTITGYVLDAQCEPVPGARVDFWQADSAGQYDNQGYTLRGYQLTDSEGHYRVETVIPGLYPGRTRHIHVKVTPPAGPTLTSQLYFPDEAANAGDRIFSPELVVTLEKTTDGASGTFNFVVQTQ